MRADNPNRAHESCWKQPARIHRWVIVLFNLVPIACLCSPFHHIDIVHNIDITKIYQDILRLSNFKSWADEEFGGVRAAFTVLDEDNSGDFNVREFIKMLRGHKGASMTQEILDMHQTLVQNSKHMMP